MDFPIANIGQRVGSAVLDMLAMFLYALLFVALLYITETNNQNLIILLAIIFGIPITFYYPIMEYFFKGQTIGKILLKLRVISVDGGSASLSEIMLRWILRVIDTNLGMILILFLGSVNTNDELYGFLIMSLAIPIPIVGMVSIMRTKYGQRVGDLAANTVVVNVKRSHSLSDTILSKSEESYVPSYPQVIDLNDGDIRTIKNILKSAKSKKGKENLIKLADKAQQRLEIKTDQEPAVFLDKLIKDYNHFALEKDENPFAG